MPPFSLILASESPRRQALLDDLGIPFRVVAPRVEEIPRVGEPPAVFSKRMAQEKARAAAQLHPNEWVLGADTIVALGKRILGKPDSLREAKKFLEALNNRTHEVITSFCIINHSLKKALARSVYTRVTFKRFSRWEIDWYLGTGEPLDKAGAYAIQGRGSFLVREIKGSYTNVVGLPLTEVLEALEKNAGFRLGEGVIPEKFEARNPKLETIANGQNNKDQNGKSDERDQ
jgi:septum formation protein